ncbi:MAG: GLPGLI family protein [Bacteroidetes bacterium]|nr:GLPGLI family protein [Bacteroidota bacterium]
MKSIFNRLVISQLFRSIIVLFILVGPFFIWKANGQATEGKIRYLMTHNWTKQMAAVEYLSKEQRDRVTYMWGNRAEWKEYSEMFFTPVRTRYQDSEERAEPDDNGYSWRMDVYDINRDFEKQTIYDRIQLLGKMYIIEDTLRPQQWKILNDIKEVAGHICMDAFWNDTLKQQKVTAWFAMDIPVSGGPERFCGLPGMILEVEINDGALLITADKIEMKTLTTEMVLPKKIKGKHIHEQDYFQVLKRHMDDRKKDEQPPFWGIRY